MLDLPRRLPPKEGGGEAAGEVEEEEGLRGELAGRSKEERVVW